MTTTNRVLEHLERQAAEAHRQSLVEGFRHYMARKKAQLLADMAARIDALNRETLAAFEAKLEESADG